MGFAAARGLVWVLPVPAAPMLPRPRGCSWGSAGSCWVCRLYKATSPGPGTGGEVHEAIISQHFISVLLHIHQVCGFLRHIKGDSEVSHGEVTYFSRRRN